MPYTLVEVDPGLATQIIESGDGVVVDVRLIEETELFGEVPGAISLPLGAIQYLVGHDVDPAYTDELETMTAEQKTRLLSMLVQHAFRNTTLLCLCKQGNRSIVATRILRSLGYHLAYSINGGLERWVNDGYPLIQAE